MSILIAEQREATLRKEITSCPLQLDEVLSDASGRYLGVNNVAESQQERSLYAQKLVRIIQVTHTCIYTIYQDAPVV